MIGLGLGLTSMRGRRRVLAFDPASLFVSGEQGAWYDPSDLSTMFTDTAGTTPAAVGDPVGRINDKSGNDNHATQETAAARPILRQTVGGLYYLEFDGVDDELVGPDLNPFRNTEAELSAFCGYRHLSAQTGYLFATNTSSSLTGHSSSYLLRASEPPDWVLGGILNPLGINQNTSDQITFVSMERNGLTEGEYGWGSSTENASIGSARSSNVMIGGRGGAFAHMRLYQFLLIDRRVTEQERVTTRDFVASNSGVTL